MLLNVYDGLTIQIYDRVGMAMVILTARNVPMTNTEFAVGPNPHTALANLINSHPVLRDQYAATAGLSMTGQLEVVVYTREPVTQTSMADIVGSSPDVLLRHVIDYPTFGLLWGGAGLLQSSLLAGGERTIGYNNAYEPRLGMVALGGQLLPVGAEINLVFPAA